MRKKNDILWKGMMEEIFDDLLRFIFPEADEVVDMQRGFYFLDKELGEIYPEPDKGSNTRFVDKLIKMYRRDGREEWFLVHLEIQGHPDKQFPERMFRYYYRMFDRYQKPITALAIFTGQDGKNMPKNYEYSFWGTHVMYRYNTFCVAELTEEALAVSNNLFALAILAVRKAWLAGNIPDQTLAEYKLLLFKSLLQQKMYTKRKIEAIMCFLNNIIVFEHEETQRIFEEQLDQITGKKNTMGIIEQLAEIKAKESAHAAEEKKNLLFVENLLKGTDFSIEKIASLANVSIDFVREVKNKQSIQ